MIRLFQSFIFWATALPRGVQTIIWSRWNDSEPLDCSVTVAHEPATKIIEYNHTLVDAGMLKADVEVRREARHGIMSVIERKNCEMDTEFLRTEKCNGDGIKDKPRLDGYTDLDDSITGSENETGDMISPYSTPIAEKETDLYTDKTVTEIGMPGLIDCLKEGAFHVKDICVDEGKSPLVKIMAENEVDYKRSMPIPHSDLDDNSYLINKVDSVVTVQDGLRSLNSDGRHISGESKGVANQCSSPEKLVEGGGDFVAIDEILNDISYEKVRSEKLLSGGESDAVNWNASSSNYGGKEEWQQSNQGESEEVILATLGVSSVTEESNNSNNTKILSFISEKENGRESFDFDSSPSLESGREEAVESAYQRTLNFVSEHGLLDGPTTSNKRFLINHGQTQSSLSGMVSLSGPILYSGSIPYSGSVSLRSDSSTTSTRSFAFPILNSEWSGSPLKMAKAERRHLRKHRGWKQALLCCRF